MWFRKTINMTVTAFVTCPNVDFFFQAQPHSSTIMLGTSRLTMLYSSSK